MDILSQMSATIALNKAGLAAGTTTTLTTGGTIQYAIKGKAYSVAKLTNGATPTTDYVTGAAFLGVKANKGSVFTVGFNAAGSLKVVQGSITDLDSSGAFVLAPQFGPIPNDFCPVGYIVIKAGSTADATTGWIFGSSNLSGVTGITYTFVDGAQLPDRPQVS